VGEFANPWRFYLLQARVVSFGRQFRSYTIGGPANSIIVYELNLLAILIFKGRKFNSCFSAQMHYNGNSQNSLSWLPGSMFICNKKG